MQIAANNWNDIYNRGVINEGIKICRSKMGSQSTGEKCCVMIFCSHRGCFSGRISLTIAMVYLSDKPCSTARTEYETPGAVVTPSCPEGDQLVSLYQTMFSLNSSQ